MCIRNAEPTANNGHRYTGLLVVSAAIKQSAFLPWTTATTTALEYKTSEKHARSPWDVIFAVLEIEIQ